MQYYTIFSSLFFTVKPSVPRIDTCIPDTWVPKNSEMSCSCRADSLGQPQGRLLWLRNRTRLLVGEYSDRSLDFKTTLNGNENEEQFECIVEWIQNSSPAIHTARIPCECCRFYDMFHAHVVLIEILST